MRNQDTVEIDLVARNDLKKKLFLYVLGLRDIWIIEKIFDELKDKKLVEMKDIGDIGKMYTFVIIYGRIFHENRIIGKIGFNRLSKVLSEPERNMHKCIMGLRNQNCAHNDPIGNSLDIYYDKDEKKIAALATLSFPYLSDHKKIIIPMLKKIKDHFEEKKEKLLKRMYSTDNAYSVNEKTFYTLSYHSGISEDCQSLPISNNKKKAKP